ncbi:MAG: hypothetical protein U0P45_02870 [Acidimicrobiales bacterium]
MVDELGAEQVSKPSWIAVARVDRVELPAATGTGASASARSAAGSGAGLVGAGPKRTDAATWSTSGVRAPWRMCTTRPSGASSSVDASSVGVPSVVAAAPVASAAAAWRASSTWTVVPRPTATAGHCASGPGRPRYTASTSSRRHAVRSRPRSTTGQAAGTSTVTPA